MKSLRLLCIALLFLAPLTAWGQQTISGTIIRSGTAPLSTLASSGATVNQIPEWSGSAWTPSTLAVGSGLALNFAGGTFTVSLSAPVSVSNGGTGQTTFTDGQLLIGDSSTNGLDKATITAGSGITVTNGHGSVTIATSGGGSGNPTDTATFGSGAPYALTLAYANTGIAPISITSGNTYRITANVNFSDSTAGDDLRAYLYDSTQGCMIPWSENRVIASPITTSPTLPTPHTQDFLDAIYTAPGNDTVQLWACNPMVARGSVLPTLTRITAEQVSGSSSQTQQSLPTLPTTGLVSHYDFSGDAAGTLSSQADLGSANLTLTAGATQPTVVAKAWNGLSMAQFTSSTSVMTNTSNSTTNLTFDMFAVCSITSWASSADIFSNGNGSGNGGYQFLFGVNNGTNTAYSVAGFLRGANAYVGSTSSLTPQNGFILLELQRSGTTTTLYINGTSEGTSTSTPTTPAGGVVVGGLGSILIGECLLYNAPLSTANQTTVTNYLMTKWGL